MDYKNGKIYQITDNAYTKMYIGSTTQSLAKRFYCHKNHYDQWKNGKCHKTTVFNIFDEFGVNNCKIELIENYPCKSREELEKKEGEHIKNNNCVNRIIVGRTQKQYYIDNKDKKKEYSKEYYLDNKDKLKEYRLDNKDKKKEYDKEYRLDNKDKLNKNVLCNCGGKYKFHHKSSHIKTSKHLSYKPVHISQDDFDFIFECDSIAKIPSTYDYIIKK